MLYAATGHTIPYHTSMADNVKHHFEYWNVQYLPINAVFRFQRNKKGKNKIPKFKASLHKCDITRADMEEKGIVLHKLWNVRYSLCDLREKCFHMWVWWQTDTNHSSYEGPPILYVWYLNVNTGCPLEMGTVKSLFVQFWFCSSCSGNDGVYVPLTWIFMRILNMWFSHFLLFPWIFKGRGWKSNKYHLKIRFYEKLLRRGLGFFVKFTFTRSKSLLDPIAGHSFCN